MKLTNSCPILSKEEFVFINVRPTTDYIACPVSVAVLYSLPSLHVQFAIVAMICP